ncbi:MAG: hypothetical protein AAGF47_08560 [Planctomycetota bacterium]
MNKFVPLLAALMTAALLTACGDGGPDAYLGTWQVDAESMRSAMEQAIADEAPAEGLSHEQAEQQQAMLDSVLAEIEMTLTVADDNSFTMTTVNMGMSDTVRGEWTSEGNGILMSDGSQMNVTARIRDGSLLLEGETVPGQTATIRFVRGTE